MFVTSAIKFNTTQIRNDAGKRIDNTRENPSRIGNGVYVVYYKEHFSRREKVFYGVCENFSTKLSAFWNIERSEMLLVELSDIVGMYPYEGENKC